MSHHPSDPFYTEEPAPAPSEPQSTAPTYREVDSAVDWLGNRFRVGEKVIYCIGAGRGQMMAIGTVVKMRAENVKIRSYYEPKEETRVDVTVQVLTEKSSGYWGDAPRTRPAWVNPMNITALPVGVES